MRIIWSLFFLSFHVFHFSFIYCQDLLKANDVHSIMQQILKEHVDKHEVTEKMIHSSIIYYIEQFDPNFMYLLESEVVPFIRLSQQELNQVIQQYKNSNFEIFEQLNDVIQKSIIRSRNMRKEIEQEAKNQLFHFQSGQSYSTEPTLFPQTKKELQDHILINLNNFIEKQKSRFGQALTSSKKEQILHVYDMKLREFENQYLYQNDKGESLPPLEKENLFSIHLLKAMAKSLDSHTSFYQDNEAYDLRVKLQKEFNGIGVLVKETNNEIVISRLLEEGPAAKSGLIKPGDVILEIDGISISDLSFDQVMDKLRDERNTQIKLVLKHPGEKEGDGIYSVELKRVMIVLSKDRVDVKSENFGNGLIGVITLHSFYQGKGLSSEQDVKKAIQDLEKKGNLRGLILDLRDNSGGFLAQAVKVAGLFITSGVIVISKYSNGSEKMYRDVDGKTTYDGPLIVLTSKATASAAEIVAQALQDYGVALIVGDEHTYGKGTIQAQTVTNNKSSSYFKVTVGMYYTPSGKTPQKNGVIPEIVVPGHLNEVELGEIYMDSVNPNTISPVLNDKLTDLSKDERAWYLKYYTPFVQSKSSQWEILIPTLQKNSARRIANNKNYQLFLKGPRLSEEELEDDHWDEGDKKTLTFGVDDLQVQEAINIMKDMILMHDIQKVEAKDGKQAA
ncbi:MAG: S41 family peptidase [Parachlamydiaceae bacterium]|nr:S41 family peptidase [Parachlamydiaceae bacterium]